jgi:L-ascorbate metabolism protein UlaG (beta-lactamase superfamily)
MLGDAPVLTGHVNAAWARARGLTAIGLDESWHDLGGGVSVRLVTAVHHSRPMPHRPNGAYGHLVRAPEAVVWLAGDTDLYDEMAELPGLAGRDALDLAIVPIAGWGPRLSAGHMGPTEAATACARTRAAAALPVHWGTLHPPIMDRFGGWIDRPLPEFRAALAAGAPDCRLLEAPIGRPVTLATGGGARQTPEPGRSPGAGEP